MLERLFEQAIPVTYDAWRPGDQKVFISNIQKAKRLLGWSPRIAPDDGIPLMVQWIRDNRSLFE
jgi:CDP-paratose 2-epimerase